MTPNKLANIQWKTYTSSVGQHTLLIAQKRGHEFEQVEKIVLILEEPWNIIKIYCMKQ